MENLIGEKLGLLTVLSTSFRQTPKRKLRVWHCRCDCGKLLDVLHYNIHKQYSCGCQTKAKKQGSDSIHWKGYGEISGSHWNQIQRGCKRGGGRVIPFNITIEYAWEIFLRQNRRCALSGLPLEFPKKASGKKPNPVPSLDRIDSSRGYEVGNIQWLHRDVNFMKNSFSEEYFRYLCEEVYKWKSVDLL